MEAAVHAADSAVERLCREDGVLWVVGGREFPGFRGRVGRFRSGVQRAPGTRARRLDSLAGPYEHDGVRVPGIAHPEPPIPLYCYPC